MNRFSLALGGLRAMAHSVGSGRKRRAKRQITCQLRLRDLRLEPLEERRLLSIIAGGNVGVLLASQPTTAPASCADLTQKDVANALVASTTGGVVAAEQPAAPSSLPQSAGEQSGASIDLSATIALPPIGKTVDGSVTPMSSLPDLVGFDFRPYGYPTAYFHIEEASPSWGSQVHLDFAYANMDASPSGSPTFNIAFYISSDSTITTSDYVWQRFTGFPVPNSGYGQSYTATMSLPASNPLSPLGAGPYYVGMILNCDNTVAESNYSNNSNQGSGKDLCSVSILPPVAVVTDSQGSSTDHAVNFGSIVNDGAGNAQAVQTVTLSNSAASSLLKVPQNGIHLQTPTNFHIVSILSNKLSQAVNVATGYSLIAANSSETWTMQVAFDPTANGSLTDALQIQTDDPSNPTINVLR